MDSQRYSIMSEMEQSPSNTPVTPNPSDECSPQSTHHFLKRKGLSIGRRTGDGFFKFHNQPANYARHYLSQTWNITSFQIRNDPRLHSVHFQRIDIPILNPMDRINLHPHSIQLQHIYISGPNLHIYIFTYFQRDPSFTFSYHEWTEKQRKDNRNCIMIQITNSKVPYVNHIKFINVLITYDELDI